MVVSRLCAVDLQVHGSCIDGFRVKHLSRLVCLLNKPMVFGRFIISHLVQVVNDAMAKVLQAVSPNFQSFRFQNYSNYPTLSMTISNGNFTPIAIEQTSVVVHRVLAVDELLTYAIGRVFHSS